jgi:WD40 repeat protein
LAGFGDQFARVRWLLALFGAIAVLGAVPRALRGADDEPPIFRIDVGSDHTAIIFGIGTSLDGKLIFTGAYDGSVRVWTASDLKPIGKTVRLPVGPGIQGGLGTIAVSPDAKTAVASGWTGSWNTGLAGPWCFYVIDLEAREIRQTVCDLPQRVNHAAFSPDGKFVAFSLKASYSNQAEGGGVRLYRTGDFSLAANDETYRNSSNWVGFDGDGHMVTASMDGYIRIYDDAAFERGGTLRPKSSKLMPENRQPDGLAISPDGKKIAVGYFEQEDAAKPQPAAIDILSTADLSLLPRPDLRGIENGVLWRPAWSDDGTYLYAAGTWKRGKHYMIRRWEGGGDGRPHDISAASTKIMRMSTLPKGQVVFATEVPSIGVVGADGRVKERPSAIADFTDIGDTLAVSRDGTIVEFPLAGKVVHFSLLQRVLELGPAPAETVLSRAVTDDPTLDVRNWDGGYNPTLGDKSLELDTHEQSLSLTYLPGGKGFVIGTIWYIRRYDANNNLVWPPVRIPFSAQAVVTTADGHLIVAAIGDGTIRWFDADTGKWLLALFPDPDGQRWAAWTPSGYYMASVAGDSLIGWQKNRGHDKAGDFYPVGEFSKEYLRPDIVTKTLALRDEDAAIHAARATSERIGATATVSDTLPPVIDILPSQSWAEIYNTDLTFQYRLRGPADKPILRIRAINAGHNLSAPDIPKLDASGEATGYFPLFVVPRDSVIEFYAENEFGAGPSVKIDLKWKGGPQGPAETPHAVHVFAVGIGQYDDTTVPKLDYSAKDAADFIAALKRQEGKAFTKVVPVTPQPLTERQATVEKIRDGLTALVRDTEKDDIGILFLAGHGFETPDGRYYFLPRDGDTSHLSKTALPEADILAALKAIKGYKILFIDTCHAADVLGSTLSTDVGGMINDLRNQSKDIIVYAAAKGNQASLESSLWHNGAFTYVVIEGIDGEASDHIHDLITTSQLEAYIKHNVYDITGRRQEPTTNMPAAISDLPIAKDRGRNPGHR